MSKGTGSHMLATMHLSPQTYLASMLYGGVFDRDPTLRIGSDIEPLGGTPSKRSSGATPSSSSPAEPLHTGNKAPRDARL